MAAEDIQELGMGSLGPANVLRPDPATGDDSKEQEGAHDDGSGSSGKGRPLDIDEGEPPRGLINGVLGVLCLLSVQPLHVLELPELGGIPVAVTTGAGDDDHFS